jgi:hypothetical protein
MPSRRKSIRKSRKPRRVSPQKRKVSPKYERCVMAIKEKQSRICFNKDGRWKGGKKCVNPFAVCTSKVGRYSR